MSILIGVAKLAFLALLWVFIAIIAQVVKRDIYGADTKGKTTRATSNQPNPKRRGNRAKQARLLVLDGTGRGDSVPLNGEVVVGRSADATLDIADDYSSGHHARFYRDNESWIVNDLESTNGTVVNGLRITRPTRVGNGDIVRIGRTRIRVEEP